ncbi:hypothetical protein JHK85_051227 [Glycine max]|nr:hypothetical protein JHK85_051227 [Glycine max]
MSVALSGCSLCQPIGVAGRRQCFQSLHGFKGDNDHHLHFEDDNVFSHCMLSKGDNDLHPHIKDDNVFSRCMPSKGDNVFIFISKMTMSSIIACLQKATMPSFTLSKMTMSSSQRLQYLLSICFIGLDVLLNLTFINSIFRSLLKKKTTYVKRAENAIRFEKPLRHNVMRTLSKTQLQGMINTISGGFARDRSSNLGCKWYVRNLKMINSMEVEKNPPEACHPSFS